MTETKFYDCPDCRGHGKVLVGKLYPSGHTECWEPCEFCEGEGVIEEDDYIVLKLRGIA
jgi:DnaJ-class molecular chaperone